MCDKLISKLLMLTPPPARAQSTPRAFSSRTPSRGRTLHLLVALLCVLLILFVGAAQVLHSHPGGEAQNPNCSLCAVAHLATHAAPVTSAPALVLSIAPVHTPHRAHAPPRRFFFSTYVRPPPAVKTPRA